MPCPVCKSQGNVYRAKIINLGIDIKICDECEACWAEEQNISHKNFKGLSSFLKEHGLTYESASICDLGYIEEENI